MLERSPEGVKEGGAGRTLLKRPLFAKVQIAFGKKAGERRKENVHSKNHFDRQRGKQEKRKSTSCVCVSGATFSYLNNIATTALAKRQQQANRNYG